MDNIRFKYYNPVVGGSPNIANTQTSKKTDSSNFDDILQKNLQQSNGVVFSKHAAKRVVERNIDVSEENMARLNQGMRLANEKNISDALILIDKTAFIVNVPSNTVITTKANEDMDSTVFTNINGTVII